MNLGFVCLSPSECTRDVVSSSPRATRSQVDEVTFKQPVEVGNLLQLDSRVLFTSVNKGPHNPHNTGTLNPSQRALYVEVVAYVTSPEHRRCKVSNTFNFTFLVDASHATPHIVPDSMECAQRMIARYHMAVLTHATNVAV